MWSLSGKNYIAVDGNKELTAERPILEYLNPKTVEIAIKHMASEKFDVHVEIGDQVKIGTLLATRKDQFDVPIFSSVSGTVKAVEKKDHVSNRRTNHLIIENDYQDEAIESAAPIKEISKLSAEEIRSLLKEKGVIGLSGSAFPTFEKFKEAKPVETIVLNGIESEPYLTSDEANMRESAELLFDGAYLLMKAAGALNVIIAITKSRRSLYEKLSAYKSKYKNISIKAMDDIYPMGWEKLLIRQAVGKSYEGDPSEAGVICINSSTAIEFARSIATGLPLYEKIVTLSGEGFQKPQNVKVRIGTNLSEVIEKIGGYTKEVGPKTARLVYGGPLKGNSIVTDDLAITPEASGFLSLLEVPMAEEPCSRCGDCVNHCPAGLQPIQIVNAFKNKDKPMLKNLGASACIDCGICTFVCPSAINLSKTTAKAKAFALRK